MNPSNENGSRQPGEHVEQIARDILSAIGADFMESVVEHIGRGLSNAAMSQPAGVMPGWRGSFASFAALMGLSSNTQTALLESLKDDPDFVEVNQKQRFLTAELGWQHLERLRQEAG